MLECWVMEDHGDQVPPDPEPAHAHQIGGARGAQVSERAPGGRFAPGHARLPGAGRKRGSRSLVHELARQPSATDENGWSVADKVVSALVDIALGRIPPGITAEASVRVRDRLSAIDMLWSRAHGKPVSRTLSLQLTHGGLPPNWDDLDDSERAAFVARLESGRDVIDVPDGDR